MLDQHAAVDLSDEADTMDSKDDWHGLDRYEARKKIVTTLEGLGLVDKIVGIRIWCLMATAPIR